MPTGGNDGEFQALAVAYGYGTDSAAIVASRMNVNPSTLTENTDGQTPGLLIGGNINNQGHGIYLLGERGSYWTRTAADTGDGSSHAMMIYSDHLGPYARNYKYIGNSIRCLLRQ